MNGQERWNARYEGWKRRRMSRRTALRGVTIGGVGAAAAATIGCGDDDDDDDAEAPGAGASPGAREQGEPKSGGTLRVRQAGDPPNLSLLRAAAVTAGFANHVYSSLLRMRMGPDVAPNQFEVEPDLAASMPEQPDDLTYVFSLRQGVVWQDRPPTDGRPVTAEEVKLAIDAYRAETSPFASDWALIDTVEATDSSTVTVRMKEPYAPFLNLSAGHYGFRIFPPELLEGDRMATEAVGTGPWMLDSYEQGNRAVYRRNPTYFRQGEPYLDELVFLIIPTDASAVAAFRSGEVDATALSCVDAEDLKRTNSDAQFEDMLGLGGYIALNTSKEPYSDVRVRRALSLALNREAENQALYCGQAQPDQLLPIGAYDRALRIDQLGDAAQYWEYDPERARQLLAEAGYEDGFSANARFTPVYGQTYQSALERAIGDFEEIGVRVEPESIDYGQWISSVYRAPYDFNDILWGFIRVYADPEPFLWFWLHPDGITNQSRINDPEITALLERQRSLLDVDERWEVLGEIQRKAAEQMYYIGRTTGVTNFVWAPWVRGFRPHIGYDSSEFAGAWDSRV